MQVFETLHGKRSNEDDNFAVIMDYQAGGDLLGYPPGAATKVLVNLPPGGDHRLVCGRGAQAFAPVGVGEGSERQGLEGLPQSSAEGRTRCEFYGGVPPFRRLAPAGPL